MATGEALTMDLHTTTKRGAFMRARGWLVRLARRVAAGIGAADGHRARLREVIRRGLARGLSAKDLVELVASEMYHEALAAGAHESDLGLFGPWLYHRDAVEFVEAALRDSAGAGRRE